MTFAEALQLVPHINIRSAAGRVTSLRVFQSGSVIIVSRWPVEMAAVRRLFLQSMERFRPDVLDVHYAKQRTLESCWCV